MGEFKIHNFQFTIPNPKMTEEEKKQYYSEVREKYDVHNDVLNYDDIVELVPKLKGHKKLVNWLLHWLQVDEVNTVHGRCP